MPDTGKPKKPGLLQDAWYISPELERDEMKNFIEDLGKNKNFFVQISKPWAGDAA